MKIIFIKLLFGFFLVFSFNLSHGQDIRGAMFNASHVNSFTYKGTLKLLIDPTLTINRPFILIDWGPSTDTLFYTSETPLKATEKQVEYIGFFTYPSTNSIPYQIVFEDSFRVSGINNITNSYLEKIKITSELVINPFLGNNNLPQLFYNPNTILENNGTYTINPNIVDSDNDSLYFKLILSTANGYYLPNATFINDTTGVITTTPDTIGIYGYVIEVDEYRNSVFIGSTMFEFVININTVVGINELQENSFFIIYPNPNNGIFTLETTTFKKSTIEIYNIAGQLILQKLFVDNTTQINLTDYPKGLYLVKIISDNKVTVKKIVYQ
ncbi:MAG: T9SS type A sorting domain-containing protein [Flavobacteriales bacterium]|nr:T9SS type A sorting domain-containing protein [Flavobacteriales bacterium]